MAFVNEFVPEEQKTKFDPEIFKQPGFLGGPIQLFRWTIDRERNVFLIRIGGGGREPEIPKTYALSMGAGVIKFDATHSAKGNRIDGGISTWEVANVCIPDHLKMKSEEILNLIREGLEAMGSPSCDRDGIVAVSVHFK